MTRITVGNHPVPPMATPNLLWSANNLNGTITLIDPGSRTVVETIGVGNGPSTPVAAEDQIWVPIGSNATIAVIGQAPVN